MSNLIRVFNQLPMWARYVLCWACICLPLTMVRESLPRGMFWAVLAGVSAFFVTFYVIHQLAWLSGRRRGSRLDQEIGAQTGGPTRLEIAEKEKEYKRKWLEGAEKLKKSKISLYQLPWYIIIGEPGGGKTMTLLNSGMDFPLGKEELPGFGGTRQGNDNHVAGTGVSRALDRAASRRVHRQERARPGPSRRRTVLRRVRLRRRS